MMFLLLFVCLFVSPFISYIAETAMSWFYVIGGIGRLWLQKGGLNVESDVEHILVILSYS